MVFYNRIFQAYVLIDLKTTKLTPETSEHITNTIPQRSSIQTITLPLAYSCVQIKTIIQWSEFLVVCLIAFCILLHAVYDEQVAVNPTVEAVLEKWHNKIRSIFQASTINYFQFVAYFCTKSVIVVCNFRIMHKRWQTVRIG